MLMKTLRLNNLNILLLLLLSFGCFMEVKGIQIKEDTTLKIDKIIIASEPDYPPYCFVDKNGNADGFSVELFIAAAKAVHMDVEIKIGIWNKIKQDLSEGTIDALPLVGRTSEREKFYDFTLPYLSLHGAVFVREGTTDILSIQDLENKNILVMKGDNAEEFLHRVKITKNIIQTYTYEEAFRRLASGEGDAILTQRVMGIKLIESLQLKTIVPLSFPVNEFRQDFCFAVKKGDTELLSRLNEGLSIVIANKTFDAIHLRWFGPVNQQRLTYFEVIKYVLYFLIPFVFLFSIVAIFFLRRTVRLRTNSLQQEIIEHQKTVNTLNSQQLLLSEMEKVTKVGGWEYDVATKKMVWTDGVYQIYGVSKKDYNPSEMNPEFKFYDKEDQEVVDFAFKQAIENGSSFDLNLRFKSADGKAKWIRTSAKPERKEEKIIRLIGNILDITEQKQSEEELLKLKNDLEIIVLERTKELHEKVLRLNKSQKAMLYMVEDLNTVTNELKLEREKLEASNKELEAFSYSVSHDLRAPLRGVLGFTQILMEEYAVKLDDEGKRICNIIKDNSVKMGQLIDDLLAFSRLNRYSMHSSEINIENMVISIYHETTEEEDRKRIELSIGQLKNAFGDTNLIKQVWINLLSNAIKFSSKKDVSKVVVSSYKENENLIYCIQDNGTGFDMKYADKLFGVFQRLHNERDFKGTGVGLAIVQRIIHRHGGKVWAESEVGKGASFYFSLPINGNNISLD